MDHDEYLELKEKMQELLMVYAAMLEELMKDMSDLTPEEQQDDWLEIVDLGRTMYLKGVKEWNIPGEPGGFFRARLMEGYHNYRD